MKQALLFLSLLFFSGFIWAENISVSGPDGHLLVKLFLNDGKPSYSVTYKGKQILEDSPLGLITNVGDFSKDLSLSGQKKTEIDETYTQTRTKTSQIHYQANELTCTFSNPKQQTIDIVFRVSNNDIAFCYNLPAWGATLSCVIEKEITGFDFPKHTTTFITPQALPMTGWKRSKPSYEEIYVPDAPVGTPSQYGVGYTFPALFHIGNDGWALISETGVSSLYCGSRLSEGTSDGLYSIAFPQPGENNGIGSSTPAIGLPGTTPWRTITVGDNLKPIVETTVPFDVVKPLYEPSIDYKPGRSTWSWIMWQDNSVNYDDQVKYIDLAAAMGYEYVLIDGLWDKQIGYDRMPSLIKYAQSKGIDVFLWYNSNGYANDAPQDPRQKMNNSIVRKKEMQWLKSLGVKGLKVDFFGGDKQETIKLYEDILSDGNDYGLMIIFHGCTVPRGWERMYPNYVGSEAVLASENLIFTQAANDSEAYNACLHPFIRNTIGCMEFGPVLLNKNHSRNNDKGRIRKTTDIFQIATAVLFQSPVQMFAIAPNNLTDTPSLVMDFMKQVPTTWDEIRFIDGYPGKYCVLARRHGDKWYVAAVNAQKEELKLKVALPMFAESEITTYYDTKDRTPQLKKQKVKKDSMIELVIQPEGGCVLVN